MGGGSGRQKGESSRSGIRRRHERAPCIKITLQLFPCAPFLTCLESREVNHRHDWCSAALGTAAPRPGVLTQKYTKYFLQSDVNGFYRGRSNAREPHLQQISSLDKELSAWARRLCGEMGKDAAGCRHSPCTSQSHLHPSPIHSIHHHLSASSLPLPAAAPPSPALLLWMSNSPSGPPIPPPLHSSSQEKQERTSLHSNPKPQSERQNRAARANISASAFWVTIKRIM